MFEIGSKVHTTSSEVGRLCFLILDPNEHEVTDLVIDMGDDEPRRIVSVADVGHVEKGSIRLNINDADLRARRPFSQEEMVVAGGDIGAMGAPAQEMFMWANPYQGSNIGTYPTPQPMTRLQVEYGVGDRFTIIGRETPVYTKGGKQVGTLDHLAVDPDSYQPRALIVRLPGIRRRRVLVAADQIADWERSGIVVDLTKDQLKALPPFQPMRSDSAVAGEIRRALVASELPLRNVVVDTADGHVVLRGRARTDEARREADRIARRATGALSVQNLLLTDRVLNTRVEGRIFEDPIGGLYPVDIQAVDGVVTVSGEVPNGAVRRIVVDLIEDTAGVEAVVDRLQERPERFDGTPPAARIALP